MEKKHTGLIIWAILMTIGCVGLGGYIIYQKYYTKTTTTELTTSTDNTKVDTSTTVNYVNRLDNTKYWIYDAEYPSTVTQLSYETTFYNTYYLSDINVPYINIDSESAASANTELKNIYNDSISTYSQGISDGYSYVDICDYKYYMVNDDTLSVIQTVGYGATSVVYPKYYNYNFNLKDGSLLTYQEVYELAGYTTDNLTSAVTSAITTTMKDKLKNMTYSDGETEDTYIQKSIANYNTSVTDGTIKYFIDSNKHLKIVVTLTIPADIGEFDTIIAL